MPAIRRRRYAKRRKRYGLKSRRAYKKRYNSRRRAPAMRLLRNPSAKQIVPPRALVKVRIVMNETISTAASQAYNISRNVRANALDWLEDQGFRNLAFERLSQLYTQYRVNAVKVKHTMQMTVSDHNSAFFCVPLWSPGAIADLGTAIGGASQILGQINEMPGSKVRVLGNEQGHDVVVIKNYIKFKNFVGSKWAADPTQFGADIIHGVADNWTDPNETIMYIYGVAAMNNGLYGSAIAIGNLMTEYTFYVKMWGRRSSDATV